MNGRESIDFESAYGSDASSNSNFLIRKEWFSMEEPTSKNRVWLKWLKQRIREYMVLEATFSIALVFLIINSCRLSSQIQETQIMILNLQSQFITFQKQVTGKDLTDFKNQNDQMNKENNKELKEMIKDALKEVKTETIDQVEPRKSQTVTKASNNLKTAHSTPKTSNIITNSTISKFNAASFISGAFIDTSRSSSSSLNPFFGFNQGELVLVDRSKTPAGNEWCTDEKEPVLTVRLSEYVKPTAVSYQHSEWNGTIPDNAPMIYDVVGCFDFYCEKSKLLFSDCKYNPLKHGEQLCNSSSSSISSPIGKVQFRFRKNQGNVQSTCVGLVRVYAEKEGVPKPKVRRLKDTKTCLDLKYNYHNSPIIYKYFNYKDCDLLYSKECCTECPECCNECDIKDMNTDRVLGYRWTKQQIRETRILEVLILIILLFVLVNSYRNHFMIVNFQAQMSSYPKQAIQNNALKSRNIEKEVNDKANKKVNEILADILRDNRTPALLSQDPNKSEVLEPVVPCTDKKPVLPNFDPKKFNAANLIIGAEVDTSLSSNSNLNPFFGFDQSDLVLVDRPNPPADKAWCTYDREPVLTVNLARVVKPIAVSYQQSKWNGTIPNDAPSFYDVVYYMKGCGLLYSKSCCSECPECCNECWIQDYNREVFAIIFLIVFFSILVGMIPISFLTFWLCDVCRRRR